MNNELKIIKLNKSKDKRGYLTKIFDQNIKINNKFNFIVKEHLISFSKQNVIRGMHYQSSNYAQNKIVYVIEGTIIDVIVNIRKKSKNYLKVYDFSLSSKKNLGIFIPKYYKKTLAEFSTKEKNEISHRSMAVRKLINFVTN